MKALADEELGRIVNRSFVASFQKVGTFKINQGQKQGGNVAVYFCAADGRVLHAIAGPVDASTFREEVNWLIATLKEALPNSKGDAVRLKKAMRLAHAKRLEDEYGVKVTPIMDDLSQQTKEITTRIRGTKNERFAPVLPLPAVEARSNSQNRGGTGSQVHQLLAGHCMLKIEQLYGAIFEGILGERVSTEPVLVASPFPNRRP